jgi:NADPH2:quinone reductase
VVCKELGGPETLEVAEVDAPTLGPGQVRIDVHAAGLNFGDTLIIQGKYQERPDPPFTPGMELAGVIAEKASDVEGLEPGTKVIAMTGTGAFAEQVVTDADWVLPLPDSVDLVQAAGFPVAYGTSHVALDHRAHLKSGEVLLVLGASGGVGLTAVEIGKAMGATVIAAASSAEKLEVARQYGADHLIDYSTESVRDRVLELTGGADVVYDPVGGDAFMQSLRCINWEGRIIVIGFAAGTIQQVPSNYILLKNCSVMGALWGAYRRKDPATMRTSLDALIGWLAEGKIKPHISHQLPLEKAEEAFRLMMERKSTGKVVLVTGRA